jgi:hypothetical protein
MKRTIIGLAVLTVMLVLNSTAFPAENPTLLDLRLEKLPTKIVKKSSKRETGTTRSMKRSSLRQLMKKILPEAKTPLYLPS